MSLSGDVLTRYSRIVSSHSPCWISCHSAILLDIHSPAELESHSQWKHIFCTSRFFFSFPFLFFWGRLNQSQEAHAHTWPCFWLATANQTQSSTPDARWSTRGQAWYIFWWFFFGCGAPTQVLWSPAIVPTASQSDASSHYHMGSGEFGILHFFVFHVRTHLSNSASPFPSCFAGLSAGLFLRLNNGHCVLPLGVSYKKKQEMKKKKEKRKHVYRLIKMIRNRAMAEKWKVCKCRLSVIKSRGEKQGGRGRKRVSCTDLSLRRIWIAFVFTTTQGCVVCQCLALIMGFVSVCLRKWHARVR